MKKYYLETTAAVLNTIYELEKAYTDKCREYMGYDGTISKDLSREVLQMFLGAVVHIAAEGFGRGPETIAAVIGNKCHDYTDVKRKQNINTLLHKVHSIVDDAEWIITEYDRAVEDHQKGLEYIVNNAGVTITVQAPEEEVTVTEEPEVMEQSKEVDAQIITERIEDITTDIIAGYVDEGVTDYIKLYMDNYDLLQSDYIDHYHYHNKVLQALYVREQAARMHGDELEIERVKDAREWISDMRGLSRVQGGAIVNELYA